MLPQSLSVTNSCVFTSQEHSPPTPPTPKSSGTPPQGRRLSDDWDRHVFQCEIAMKDNGQGTQCHPQCSRRSPPSPHRFPCCFEAVSDRRNGNLRTPTDTLRHCGYSIQVHRMPNNGQGPV